MNMEEASIYLEEDWWLSTDVQEVVMNVMLTRVGVCQMIVHSLSFTFTMNGLDEGQRAHP